MAGAQQQAPMHSTSSREKWPSGVTCLWPMPERLLAVVQNFISATQHAADIGAHLDVVSARRPRAQHAVVAEHVADIQVEKVKALGDLMDRRSQSHSPAHPCAYSSIGTKAERFSG